MAEVENFKMNVLLSYSEESKSFESPFLPYISHTMTLSFLAIHQQALIPGIFQGASTYVVPRLSREPLPILTFPLPTKFCLSNPHGACEYIIFFQEAFLLELGL